VWRDTTHLWPGEDWRAKIRCAITDNALVFIACFSQTSVDRARSYQNEELILAIDELRLRRIEDPWFIPVRFDDCDMPDLSIGGGRTLVSIQHIDLFGDRYAVNIARLIAAIQLGIASSSMHRTADALASDRLREPIRSVLHDVDRRIFADNAALLQPVPRQQPTQPQFSGNPASGRESHTVVGLPGPPQTVTFEFTPRQRVRSVFIVIFMLAFFVITGIGQRVSFGTGIFFSVLLISFISAIVAALRSQLTLAPEGIYLRRWKTAFIPWEKIKVVEARVSGRRFRGKRHVKFSFGNRSRVSWAPL
jgi:hypothetical protein